jgi:GTP-binding protein
MLGSQDELAPSQDSQATQNPIQLAVIGRPNVGKSTLINTLLGQERVLTGPEPGLTRDAISIEWRYKGRDFRLIDTAGLRRKARVQEKLEKLSVADALRALKFAEIAVLVIDAEQGVDRQDLTIAGHVLKEGRALVIAANKWDVVRDRGPALREIEYRLTETLAEAQGLAIVPVSARSGQGMDRLLTAALDVYDRWNCRISTAKLNRWLGQATEAHPPPAAKGRAVRLRYMAQTKSRPPSFVIFANRPAALPQSYMRYLGNSLREAFKLQGVVVRLHMRRSENPYA